MTVRVRRSTDLAIPPETVWEFISDPAERAAPISVVDRFEEIDEGMRWHIALPVIDRTMAVDTVETHRDPPHSVAFEGRSRLMHVRGRHSLEPTDRGTQLTSRFVVDGRLPGVERFFEKNLDAELENIESALRDRAGETV
jgi:carbon monoxide dehydrogenase subunit G